MRRTEMRRTLLFGIILAGLASPAGACTVSATGVAFGTYDSLAALPDDGVGSIELSCHPSVHGPEIMLGPGSSGGFAPRTMTSGAGQLAYNLYSSAARNLVWGDGGGGTMTVTLSGGVSRAGERRFVGTIYGRIPAGQTVPAGSYGDTIMITVIF